MNTPIKEWALKKRQKRQKRMRSDKGRALILFPFFFSAVLIILCQQTVNSQYLPPAKYDGFLYNTNHRLESDTIMIEAFFDPVCPNCRDAWPPLKLALLHYASRVSLRVHLLPLPYHDNAFATSRALHIVNMQNSSATFQLLESFFEHQARFYNAETSNKSRDAVVDEIINFTADSVGNSYYSAIASGFKDMNTDIKTRISFKYSASRGVFGTPVFYINGFALPDTGSSIDYKKWRSFIDPLLVEKSRKRDDLLQSF